MGQSLCSTAWPSEKKNTVADVQEVGWAPLSVWADVKNFTRTGIRSPYGPSSSKSLYRLRFDILQIHSGCQPTIPILNQLKPVHNPKSYFLKIHLNIIFLSNLVSPKWSLSLSFPYLNPEYTFLIPHKNYMPRPSHSSQFYHPNNIMRYTKFQNNSGR
jgi:hypothetical protein